MVKHSEQTGCLVTLTWMWIVLRGSEVPCYGKWWWSRWLDCAVVDVFGTAPGVFMRIPHTKPFCVAFPATQLRASSQLPDLDEPTFPMASLRLKRVWSSGVSHVSSMVVLSRTFFHEHFLFFTYLSCYITRTLITSRTYPSSVGWQVAPSRITLAWEALSKDSPERTVVAVPLRQETRAYQWGYERPFASLVMSWPFAHGLWGDPHQGFCARLHQVSWCRYPFFLTGARVLFVLFVIHSRCMHDQPNTACRLPKKITLAWRPAEWRKPAHNNSHRSWAQRAWDCFIDLRNNWSISIVWCAWKFGEKDHRALITEEVEEYGEIRTAGVLDSELSETSFFQSQMQFDDSVEGIADSDLEDGEFQKMLTSPLSAQKASGKPDALVVQEREVSAQLTQAEKESLRPHSSEGHKASGKPDAIFSSEQGNQMWSSVFRNADPSNLRGSLLEGDKDHLLNHARSDLAKQELHVVSLSECISELQRQAEEQRLALPDAQHGFVESRQEQVRLQEELMKEKILRDTQIRNMREIEKLWSSCTSSRWSLRAKFERKSCETIQKLTFQLQEMQERMNSMSDSGNFQDVESNDSGKLSHVSSQPAMIRSSRSSLSRDNRLPLDTCNQSGLQENVFLLSIYNVWFVPWSL